MTNGRRLDAGMLVYQNLGNYSCWDERTGERLILRITDSKNTDRIKNRKKINPSFLLLALIKQGWTRVGIHSFTHFPYPNSSSIGQTDLIISVALIVISTNV